MHRFTRSIFVGVFIAILLAISFGIIVILKKKAKENNNKYSQGSCKELYNIYGEKYMKEYAVEEWFSYYEPVRGVER